MKLRKKRVLIMALAGIFLLALSLLLDSLLLSFTDQLYVNSFIKNSSNSLNQKESAANALIEKWTGEGKDELLRNREDIYRDFRDEGLFLYAYEGNNLIFWTDNKVFPERLNTTAGFSLQRLANGYYVQKNSGQQNLHYVVLIPVLNKYSYQNQYLKNKLALSDEEVEVKLYETPTEGAKDIYSTSGHYLFSLKVAGSGFNEGWTRVLFLLGLFLLIFSLHRLIQYLLFKGRDTAAIGVFGVFTSLFVLIWKGLGVPSALFHHDLFSPQHYASSYLFASIGDLLIFTILLCYGIWLSLRIRQATTPSKNIQLVFKAIELVFLFIFTGLFEHVVSSLVIDSRISFNLSNFFSLSVYSILGLIILYIWLYCLFLWGRILSKALCRQLPHWSQLLSFLSVTGLVAAAVLYLAGMFYTFALLFTFAYLVFLYSYKRKERKNKLSLYIGSLIFSAGFVTLLLSYYNTQKTWQTQQSVAQQVITERDAVAEYLFAGIYHKVKADPYLKSYFTNPVLGSSFVSNRLKQLYFSGYYSKYDISVTTFNADGRPFKSPVNRSLSYFLEYLVKNATPVQGSHLYFLHQFNGLPSYIAAIPVSRGSFFIGTVLLEFQQKPFYEESVYPELLLTDNFQRYNVLQNFSYAVYNNNILSTQKGDFPFPGLAPDDFRSTGKSGYVRINARRYNHFVYHFSDSLTVVVSTPEKNLLHILSTFSFLLIFFGLVWIIQIILPPLWELWYRLVVPGAQEITLRPLWKGLAFRYKILATVIGSMTIAMLLIGFATVKYISYQYGNEEKDQLRKKTVVVTSRVENAIEESEMGSQIGEDELNSIIKDISNVYQADINLYDIEGSLVSTTQSLLYERKLIAPKMHALAYIRFAGQYASLLVKEEQIGDLHFIASYMPLRNHLGQVTGYLNLPYFSKEQELNERISSFMVALINIYLLLFIILLLLGIFMSRGLIAPLDIIRKHLRTTGIGKSQPIEELHTDDEIGKMVREYNTMILELDESARRLAQTQREMVGRDMARQVAHEIKNPLTPMKLNIQRLQRAYSERADDFDNIFRRVTQLLINQIESLSEIATSFSTYARLPEGEPEAVDVNKALRMAAELFSQSSGIHIKFDLSPDKPFTYIDNDQLGRVFNNLIKNSIQAAQNDNEVSVGLKSFIEKGRVIIEIEDDAAGIPEYLQDKIFAPNFSTKSSGMGLGLAIVKDIIEKAGGKISFHTQPGQGTTFVIELPLYKQL